MLDGSAPYTTDKDGKEIYFEKMPKRFKRGNVINPTYTGELKKKNTFRE